jgi:hypothetical protein
MIVSYDTIIKNFLQKITEYKLLGLPESTRDEIVQGYMKNAISDFSKECREKVVAYDDENETVEFENDDLDEIEVVNLIAKGMAFYWMQPYIHHQDLLELRLNTSDFLSYSPAELLKQVRIAYGDIRMQFKRDLREYTYNNGDLTDLHI